MIQIAWDEKMSVLVDQMDGQHKKLIAIINDFYSSMSNNESKQKLQTVIKSMKDYTVLHFCAEELLMQQNCYPGLEEHKREHKLFIDKVIDLQNRYTNGKLILSLEVATFLKDWLTNHIMNTDKKYGVFLHERGIK